MSTLIDQIGVDGQQRPGHVRLSFANIDLDLDVDTARKLARALLEQAEVSELEKMGRR